MKKLLFLPIFLFGLTTYPDFSLCYKKFKNYSLIPVSKNYSITSKKPKQFIRYDERLKIYLVKHYNKNYIHFKSTHLGTWIAAITKNSIYSGNYAEYQTPKNLAQISTSLKIGSIVSDIFCKPIGIGVNGGFLDKNGIQKFIKNSLYLTKSENKNKLALLKIGLVIDDSLNIIKVIPNSIASRHYIDKGKIIKINSKFVVSLDNIKKIHTITIRTNGYDFKLKVD